MGFQMTDQRKLNQEKKKADKIHENIMKKPHNTDQRNT